jgi:hypothetical protein
MLTTLCVITFALPATGETTRVQTDVYGTIEESLQANDNDPFDAAAHPDATELHGTATLAVTIFLDRKLIDDDAPLSLQPFLQRPWILRVSGRGDGSEITLAAGTAKSSGGELKLSAEGHPHRHVYLRGELAVAYSTAGELHTLKLPASLTLGARFYDVALYAGYGVTPSRSSLTGNFQVAYWGGAFTGVTAVVKRSARLDANMAVIDGGAQVSVSMELFFGRRLGLLLGANGGRGADAPGHLHDRVGAAVAVSYWFMPRLAASIDVGAGWTWADTFNVGTIGVTLGLSAR